MTNDAKAARFMLAAPKSGSGKTTITCGLIAVLKKRGLKVSSIKCGPDYIDPMFHRRALGVQSGNLDTFFFDVTTSRAILGRKMEDFDITVLEGVMGYYDGMGGTTVKASTYEVASVTETPVILVVDAKGISVTLAAVIKGIMAYREDSGIKGVILNRVSAGYYPRLKSLVERECGIPVLGFLPELPDISVPSRHLGLVSPEELQEFDVWINKLSEQIEKNIDIDALISVAATAPPLSEEETRMILGELKLNSKVRLAVANDEAFSFYYAENMEYLEALGVELVFFSPLRDKALPDNPDCILLGGGYPEMYAKELSENTAMLDAIRKAYSDGVKIIAECGGFMYLLEELSDDKDKSYPMLGIIKGRAGNAGRLCRFGYVELSAADSPSFTIKGHEFHRWDSNCNGTTFIARKPVTGEEYSCMHLTDSLLAGYPHLSYLSNKEFIYKLFTEKWNIGN